MSRTPIPQAELASDLQQMGHAAQVISNALVDLIDNRYVPPSSLPNLHAAKRSAASLVTQIEAAGTLVDAEVGRD